METRTHSCGLTALLAANLLLGLAGACGGTQEAKEIVMAVVAPTSGQYAEMGNDVINAVRMAVDEQNASGGVAGIPVRLVVEDDKGSPKDAVSVAHKLVADASVLGIVGHLNSGTTLAASSVYAAGQLPVVMPVPTNPQITQQGFSNLFRIPVTDDRQGPALAEFMLDRLNKKQIAVVHNKDAYGEGIATEVRKTLLSRGVNPLAFESVNASDQDFRSLLTRLKRLNPELIFFGGGYAEAALFIRQAKELGLAAPVVMGDGCFDSQLMKIAGPAADGSYISNIAPTTGATPELRTFFSGFESKYGKTVAFAPLGYVSAKMLLDAIAKAPQKTRSGVLAVLRDPTYRFGSMLGDFAFESNGDSRGQRVFMHVVEGGQFATVK